MRRVVPLLGFAALVACSDTLPVEHLGPSAPHFSAAGDALNRYVILLSNGANAEDFTSSATSLGVDGGGQCIRAPASPSSRGCPLQALPVSDASAACRRSSRTSLSRSLSPLYARTDRSGGGRRGASVANPAGARIFGAWNMRAIGAPTAWTANRRGSASVTVAILDRGSTRHTRLQWRIPRKTHPCQRVSRPDRSASFLPTSSLPTGAIPAGFDARSHRPRADQRTSAFGPCPAAARSTTAGPPGLSQRSWHVYRGYLQQ